MGDLTGIAERKDRVLRMKEQLLLKVQTKVMMVSPSPSAVGGVLGSIVIRQVRLLMGPTDVRAGPRGPASHPLIQPRSRRKPQQTRSFIASVIALMMDD